MGTSAPAVREHDIPITKPQEKPKRLPAPDPERWYTPMPVTQPARQPVRKE